MEMREFIMNQEQELQKFIANALLKAEDDPTIIQRNVFNDDSYSILANMEDDNIVINFAYIDESTVPSNKNYLSYTYETNILFNNVCIFKLESLIRMPMENCWSLDAKENYKKIREIYQRGIFNQKNKLVSEILDSKDKIEFVKHKYI